MNHSIQKVRTRFAPSPTGDLHLGAARTALFNWLFARHFNGEYLLRIEDTDQKRSTPKALETILRGLEWLGLKNDGEIISQFKRGDRHREVAKTLIEKGAAYYCYSSIEEIEKMRDSEKKKGSKLSYKNPWRDADPNQAPKNIKPVVRLKVNRTGSTEFNDMVQGRIIVKNDELDDMVLLRSDGSPTYMLAVVVDDHDMDITHVIRGDDHLTNTFRQIQIYQALGWEAPFFAHIPLIHGQDGKKLSKRHGATDIKTYADMGILSKAMLNYLLRLGWSHGNNEIISINQAIEWFDTKSIGKSPARFDIKKLINLNSFYIRNSENVDLIEAITPVLEEKYKVKISQNDKDLLTKAMNGLKERSKTLLELAENSWFYIAPLPLNYTDKAQKFLSANQMLLFKKFIQQLDEKSILWNHDALMQECRTFVEENTLKMKDFSQTIRSALTGQTISPSVFEIMEILGKEGTLQRIECVPVF